MAVKSYQDLVAWQKAMELAIEIYRVTKAFPKDEMYGLVSQMRRAAVSVPSNIAEGQMRNTKGEFLQFIGQSRGSLAELETQITLSMRLGYLREEQHIHLQSMATEVGKLLTGLYKSLATNH